MDRHETIEWMDAVASNWPRQRFDTQIFMERWWHELFDGLKYDCLEVCCGMWDKEAK